jgi:hypothetical protein
MKLNKSTTLATDILTAEPKTFTKTFFPKSIKIVGCQIINNRNIYTILCVRTSFNATFIHT